jgi:rhodanese-related sulfurtransferase
MANQKARKGYDRSGSGPAAKAAGLTPKSTGRMPATTSAFGGVNRNLIGLVVVIAVLAVGGLALLLSGSGKGAPGTGSTGSTVVQGQGGTWTNISADTLATRLTAKDFTLLNVKTPYIGEIAGTDLYIPYTDLAARASQLPANKAAPIIVYCRSGAESAIAAQTLLNLGYTNILNLDGGMNAWQASGRGLVQKNRT